MLDALADARIVGLSPVLKELVENLFEGAYLVDADRRIVLWNDAAERISGYAETEVKGRSCSDDILVHIDAHGQPLCGSTTCPAARSMHCGKRMDAEVFLKHRQGHRVPISIRSFPLQREDGSILGAIEIFTERCSMESMSQRIQELERLALLDELTSVGNRRYAERELTARHNELARFQVPYGVLMIDLDHFKRVNDRHGHLLGDRVLRMVADTLAMNVRSCDHVARWGGEEFMIIVSNVNPQGLQMVASKLRALVECSHLSTTLDPVTVTASIGGTLAQSGEKPQDVVERADQQLYFCKARGRNCISIV